jgi:hypothetical protein
VVQPHRDHRVSGPCQLTFIRLNLLLLLAVSFLPFPTRLVADYIGEVNAERVAVIVLGINLLLTLILVSVVWRYAVQAQLVRPDLADEDVRTLTKRLTPTLGAYVVMIIVGLFLPVLAVLGYLVLALIILIPFSALRNRRITPDIHEVPATTLNFGATAPGDVDAGQMPCVVLFSDKIIMITKIITFAAAVWPSTLSGHRPE